ncbi:MAG: tetratricopeptide repeat protein [Terriglobales bacterium]
MFRRIVFSSALVLFSAILAFPQGGQTRQPRVTTDLTVRVSYEDERAVEQVRVQVTNSSGVPIAENFTRGEGEVRFSNMEPGSYRLRVTGMDIEEKTSDYAFTILPRQMTHTEFIRVRRKPNPNDQTSLQGSISAAALNIPSKAKSEFDKGVKALRKQDNEEALRRFTKAVELYPRYADAYNNLGVIAMQRGNKDEGLQWFRQAVEADDQYAPPYLNLAKAIVAKQEYAEAERLLLRATTLDPTNVEILAILAMIEYDSKNFPMALANGRKVHGLPNHEKFAFAHYIVGRVLEAQSQPQEAIAEYRLFLKEAPDSSSAASVRGYIAELEAAASKKKQ